MTDDDIRRSLVERADAFCGMTGTSRTDLGLAALNDGAVITQIAEGRNIKLSTYQKLMTWLDEHWPSPPTQPR